MKLMTKEEVNNAVHLFMVKIQRVGFWIIVFILIGACIGAYAMREYQQSNIDDWKKQKCFIYKGDVYKMELDPTKNN